MSYKVLLIDDNRQASAALSRMLREAHLEVLLMRAEDSVAEKLDSHRPHLLLICAERGSQNGIAICRGIREHERFSIIPIMMVSEVHEEAILLEGYRAGAEDYISMDLPGDVLVEKVFSLLRIRAMYDKLKELDLLKDEFLSSVSHELRTPLAIVRENVALVHDGVLGPVTKREKDALKNAIRGIDRLTGIVGDLLDMSQLQAGSLDISRSETDLIPILDEVYQAFSLSASANQIEFKRAYPSALPVLLADGKRIRQVFVNLLGNAFKFTPRGGAIALEASETTGGIHIAVRDTGPGIPREALKHLFDRFFRLNALGPHHRDVAGSGIGLNICRNLVDAHGGKIWAESEVGKGSAFHVVLPFKEELKARSQHYVLQELRLAEDNQWECAAIVVELLSMANAGSREKVRDALIGAAKEIATRSSDLVLRLEEDRIAVFLHKTSRSGAAWVEGRIKEALSSLCQLNPGWPDLRFRTLCFPEDAKDPEAFYALLVAPL